MFEDSLLERRFSKSHREGATMLSFAIQVLIIAALVVAPMMFVEALPSRELVTVLVAPSPPPPPPPAAETPHVKVPKHKVESEVLDNGELRAPSHIPKKIAMIKEIAPPPTVSGVVGGVPGGVPGGASGGVIGSIVNSGSMPPLPKLVAAQPRRIRISQGVSEGLLIHKVEPLYPEIAREARVQGPVVLKAVIAKDGTVQHLQLVRGNPMLVSSAIDAVKEWRFRPYLLNGQPVGIETTITINFHLG